MTAVRTVHVLAPAALAALALVALVAWPHGPARAGETTGEACPTVPPPGWVLEVGYGTGNQADALRQAREDAAARLEAKVCAGLSEARCAGVRRSIRPWRDGEYTASKRAACAAVAIEDRQLDALKAEAEALDAELATLAAAVAGKAQLLRLEPPVWDSGCSAGEVGAYLLVTIEGQLGRSTAVRLDMEPETSPDAARLRLKLAPGPGGVVVVGLLQDPLENGWTPLTGPKFALDLFDIDAGEVGQCRGNGDLGLDDAERDGDGGLTVRLTIPGNTGLYCSGAMIEPHVETSAPARVKVYDVLRDGTAHLIWPPPGGDGLVDGSASLGPMQLLADPDAGDERLVAVAVPAEGGSFGAADDWTGFCRIDGAFGEPWYPAGAAVGSATYSVTAAGEGGCPGTTDTASAETAALLAPVCGP